MFKVLFLIPRDFYHDTLAFLVHSEWCCRYVKTVFKAVPLSFLSFLFYRFSSFHFSFSFFVLHMSLSYVCSYSCLISFCNSSLVEEIKNIYLSIYLPFSFAYISLSIYDFIYMLSTNFNLVRSYISFSFVLIFLTI